MLNSMKLLRSSTSGNDRVGNSHQYFSQEKAENPDERKAREKTSSGSGGRGTLQGTDPGKGKEQTVWAVSRVLCPFQKKQVRSEQSYGFQDQEGTRSPPWREFLENLKLWLSFQVFIHPIWQ